MPRVRKEFTFAIPNEWYSDDFSEGKTGTFVYEGREYITIEIDINTGREAGWCLYNAEELERPCAKDIKRFTVDCKENPLLCEIVNDQGRDEDRDFYDNRKWKILHKAPEGYIDVEIPDEFHPRDIYDEFSVKYDFEKEEFIIPVRTWKTIEKIDHTKVTWDHFRKSRDQLLYQTDGVTDPGMPQNLIDEWEKYRQLLRDAPENLAEFGPFFAGMMLPPEPEGDTVLGEEDIFADIMIDEEDL